MKAGLVQKVVLRNYRSIRSCKVELSPLTVIVGRNAAGKSNFVDALRFVNDALCNQLDFALRVRGGIEDVPRRAPHNRPASFTIELELAIDVGRARYGFTIAPVAGGLYEVAREQCVAQLAGGGEAEFVVQRGVVTQFSTGQPGGGRFGVQAASPVAAAADRLFLVSVSNLPQFRPVHEALSRMVFHNLNPDAMKGPQKSEPGMLLAPDGHNIASVFKELAATDPAAKARVLSYLNAIGVAIEDVQTRSIAGYETIEFSQKPAGTDRSWKFDASSMSDGTMRAMGILVSLMSAAGKGRARPTLVAVEEPETALHPAAAGTLLDALSEASQHTQVLVTCHSPDLLDQPALNPDSIIVAAFHDGSTHLGRISPAMREVIRDHLQTAGEMLRIDQLTPDPAELQDEDASPTLFEAFP